MLTVLPETTSKTLPVNFQGQYGRIQHLADEKNRGAQRYLTRVT